MNQPALTERGPPRPRRLARKQSNFPVRLPDQLPGTANTLGTPCYNEAEVVDGEANETQQWKVTVNGLKPCLHDEPSQ
jgi:hypothetical protein